MMLYINNAVPIIGVAIMFYVMLTHRINTRSFELGLFFSITMALWVLLFWADWTKEFVPVWQTVSARVAILSMMICVISIAWKSTVKKKSL